MFVFFSFFSLLSFSLLFSFFSFLSVTEKLFFSLFACFSFSSLLSFSSSSDCPTTYVTVFSPIVQTLVDDRARPGPLSSLFSFVSFFSFFSLSPSDCTTLLMLPCFRPLSNPLLRICCFSAHSFPFSICVSPELSLSF